MGRGDSAPAGDGLRRLAPLAQFIGPLLVGGAVGLAPVIRAALAHPDVAPSPPGAIMDAAAAASVAPAPAPLPAPAAPAPPSDDASTARPPTLTLAGADANGVLRADANDGKLDELLEISSNATASTSLHVSLTEARPTFASLGDAAVYLEAPDGELVVETDVVLAAGAVVVLPLRADLPRPASYVGELHVASKDAALRSARVFRLQIHATAPPLGLRLTDFAPEPVSVWPGGRATIAKCVGVDTPPPLEGARLAAAAVASPTNGAHHLPDAAATLKADDRCPDGTALLAFPPLAAGRYEGVLDVQGEKLNTVIIVQHKPFMAVLAVLFGALLTVISRELVKYFKQRTENEGLIEAAKPSAFASALDRALSHNALRRARGSNVMFLMESVPRELKGVDRVERAGIAPIQAALDAQALPDPVGAPLRERLGDLLALSSVADQPELERGLLALQRSAERNFRRGVADWLRALESQIEACRHAIDAMTEAAQRARQGSARTALWVLGQLVSDAAWLVSHDERRPESDHVELLVDVPTRLAELARWVESGPDGASLPRDVAFAARARARLARVPGATALPATAIVVGARPAELAFWQRLGAWSQPKGAACVRALTEVTLRVDPEIPGELGANLRFVWTIDDGRHGVQLVGGPRLTFVFEGPGRARRVVVRAHRPGAAALPCSFAPAPQGAPRRDELTVVVDVAPAERNRTRRLSWLADQASSLVFALVTGLVALAFYWEGKGFGDVGDYMALITAGIGVDFSVGSVRKLLPGSAPAGAP